ncbi:MAG: DUF1566 domain-containing protein [Candidatus Saccharibacteria bacterium]
MIKYNATSTDNPKAPKPRLGRLGKFAVIKNRRLKMVAISLSVIIAIVAVAGISFRAGAESRPGGSDNGLTSTFLGLYNSLVTSGYGSDTNSPDLGSMWNRITTASQFTLSGNATAAQVKSGQTFYNNNRTQATGTYPAPAPCPTQAWHDSYGAPVTQTTNCTNNITWTTPSSVVTGDDKQDPVTGLIWSKYLANSAGTAAFVASGGSTWSWDASHANNIAVGNKTAITLCSSMNGGGVWRLPTQKELMLAYIDGSFFNLTNPSNYFWSATQVSSTVAWNVSLSNGYTSYNAFATAFSVRCVR